MDKRCVEVRGIRISVAYSFGARLVGLLGRRALAPDEGLLLAPCSNIHTLFMRFAIDVVFLDSEGLILAIHRDVKPWRVRAARRAYACLELAGGGALRAGLAVDQRLARLASHRLAVAP
ncbi:DUF192 domain-containing protein [Massilia rubra]|uniref:DUF192 domain-containing protein n=1 Tax=Massilia rubra TaxID=2607910 RepID=A0ABX0LKW2_9BURK|nr:DUF192 domain-containing protein [Massilia rubra]NHZ35294.1 DUF192 domain-containing protein [Massilia rubra]